MSYDKCRIVALMSNTIKPSYRETGVIRVANPDK